jgi:hypothetical protein
LGDYDRATCAAQYKQAGGSQCQLAPATKWVASEARNIVVVIVVDFGGRHEIVSF